MKIDGSVREMGVVPILLRDRGFLPNEKCLLGEAQYPAGHRDRDPVDGQPTDQRDDHFGSDACDKYAAALLLQRPDPFPRLPQLESVSHMVTDDPFGSSGDRLARELGKRRRTRILKIA